MNCAFDKEKLTGFYDGELDAAEKAEVERQKGAESKARFDEATRRATSEDRALGQQPLATELRKNLAESKPAEGLGRGEAGALKPTAPADAPKPPGAPPPAPEGKPVA